MIDNEPTMQMGDLGSDAYAPAAKLPLAQGKYLY